MNITVIGAGYVGLVTGVCLAKLGNNVICVDNNIEKIKALNNNVMPFYEPGLEQLVKENTENRFLSFSSSINEGVEKSDILFIAVNTPSKANGDVDMSYVENVSREIALNMKSYRIIVSKSTVPVETGKKIKKAIGLYNKKNVDFDVVSNPEFLREGSAIKDFMEPDRVVIGTDSEKAKNVMNELYKKLNAPIINTDIESAELIKHASNSFLALKISYINAVAQFCEKVGADIKKVAEGIGYDKRIGRSFLDAGIGFGGSCFPKDLSAFISITNKVGYNFDLLKCVKEINYQQKMSFVDKVRETLWTLNDKTIAVLGLSFKPNTDDMREAPSLDIIQALVKEGAKVKAYDPVAMDKARPILPDSVEYGKNAYDITKGSNAVLLLTEWDEFKSLDFKKIKELLATPIIIDGRNLYNPEELKELNFIYKGVGNQ